MNFVQPGYDSDENFIADLIREDQNKSDQDLNVNEMNFVQPNYNLDEDLIMDLIRVHPKKSDSYAEESLPTFYPSSSSPEEENMKHFNSFSPNPRPNTKHLVTDMSNTLKSSVIWRPWL